MIIKYFLSTSKFSIYKNFSRAVSYKTRRSIIYALNQMEKAYEDNPATNLLSKTKNAHCSRFAFQVLGNGALDSTGVIVHAGKCNYLFNCGEGIQRCASSYGIKLLKTNCLFVTSHSWHNIGGIMGMALTLQSLGVKEFNVFGPPVLKKVVSSWETFVHLKSLTVKLLTENATMLFDDGFLRVQFVPLYKYASEQASKSLSESTLKFGSEQNVESEHEKIRSHSESRSSTEKFDIYTQCYICKTPEFGGHIDVQACVQKGLKIGPMIGILQKEKSIVLEDGREITFNDVCATEGKSKIFIVIDCPTTQYLDALLNEKQFTLYQSNGLEPADIIIHFTPPEVINSKEYQKWMSRFPSTTKHMIINSDNSTADLIPVHHAQTKLNYLNEDIFPALNSSDLPVVNDEFSGKMGRTLFNIYTCKDEEKEHIISSLSKNPTEFSSRKVLKSEPKIFNNFNGFNIIRPLPTLMLDYYPKQNYDLKHNIAYDPLNCVNELKSLDNMNDDLAELAEFTRKWKASDEYKNLPDYPRILFLGTGSSTPSRYRSASGILIFLDENNIVLFDCGEGTYQQLQRLFGKEKMPEFMEKLKMIYVTHHHADHHLGMINILIKRRQFLKKLEDNVNNSNTVQLVLLVPSTISNWLNMNEQLYGSFLYNTKVVQNSALGMEYCSIIEFLNKIGISKLRVCRVDHCRNSTGISITSLNDFKITYSGDCRPSSALMEIGANSDILIHEATFENDLAAMAKKKYHCTIQEAITVGQNMRAKYILLTHFSQRYSHVPYIPDEMPEHVFIAFDNMMVTAKTFPLLMRLSKFYKMVFADKIEKLNSKLLRRNTKREVEDSIPAKIKITS